MDELPNPREPMTQEEQERLQEAFDEWLLEDAVPHIAS